MSANNQTLVKEHNGKFYVFTNVMAESWCELDENDKPIHGRDNELSIKVAKGIYDTRDEAYEAALKFTEEEDSDGMGTEYGVQFNRLCKDGAEVVLIDD